MNLQSNDFELFNIPQQFSQDKAVLARRWKELQRQAHPDQHVGQGVAAQRVAMQWSVRINEAYQRLKDPLCRAAYLCELAGVALGETDNTAMPPAFLMQQMQWRESLDDANSREQVMDLSAMVSQSWHETLHQCAQLLDQQHNYLAAAAQVRALMFIARFQRDIDHRQDALDSVN